MISIKLIQVLAKLPNSHRIVDLLIRKYKFTKVIVSALKRAQTLEALYKLINKRLEKSPIVVLPQYLDKKGIKLSDYDHIVFNGECLIGKDFSKALLRKKGLGPQSGTKLVALYLNTDKVKKILNGQDKLSTRDIKLAESDIRAILEHEWVHVIQARKVSRNLSSTKEHAAEYSEWHESDNKEPDFKKLGKKVYQLLKPYNRAYTRKLTKQILTTMQLHAKLEGKSLKEFLVDMVSKNGTPKKKLKTITAIALLKRFTNMQEYRSRTSEIQAYATSAANDLIAVYNALTKGHKTYDSDIYTQLGKLIGFYISTQYVDGGKIYKYFVKNLVQAIEQRVKDSKDVKAIIKLYKSVAKSARQSVKATVEFEAKKVATLVELVQSGAIGA